MTKRTNRLLVPDFQIVQKIFCKSKKKDQTNLDESTSNGTHDESTSNGTHEASIKRFTKFRGFKGFNRSCRLCRFRFDNAGFLTCFQAGEIGGIE